MVPPEQWTGDGGTVQIGDLWSGPRGTTFSVLSFDRPGHAILRNERLGHEDGAVISRMTRENGWNLIRRAVPDVPPGTPIGSD